RHFAAAPTVLQLQGQQLPQQLGALRFRRIGQECFELRSLPVDPGRFKTVADGVQMAGQGGRPNVALQRKAQAHDGRSWLQMLRITRSLRSTVRGTQPSLAAISVLVYPS